MANNLMDSHGASNENPDGNENLKGGERAENSPQGQNNENNQGNENGPQTPEFILGEGFDVTSIPEKFRGADGIRIGDMVKSYVELEKERGKLSREAPPEDGNYVFNPPEVEGFTAEQLKGLVPEDDPLFAGAVEFAKENKWSQKEFDGIVSHFINTQIAQGVEDQKKQIEALGGEESARKIIEETQKYFKGVLSAEYFDTMRQLSDTAGAIKLFNYLREQFMKEPRGGGDAGLTGATPLGGALTEEELRSKIASDAYQNPSHPDHLKVMEEVAEGYRKLYPGKRQIG